MYQSLKICTTLILAWHNLFYFVQNFMQILSLKIKGKSYFTGIWLSLKSFCLFVCLFAFHLHVKVIQCKGYLFKNSFVWLLYYASPVVNVDLYTYLIKCWTKVVWRDNSVFVILWSYIVIGLYFVSWIWIMILLHLDIWVYFSLGRLYSSLSFLWK